MPAETSRFDSLPVAASDPEASLRDLLGPGEDAYPRQLAQRFPHVLRRIEELWGTDQIYRFLDALTPEDAAQCKGFPPEVEAEIRGLQVAYRARYPEPPPVEPQAAPAQESAEPEEPQDDWDIWRNERRLRRWDERSVF